jgi:hypothetical protein
MLYCKLTLARVLDLWLPDGESCCALYELLRHRLSLLLGNVLQLQGGHEDGELAVGRLNLAAHAAQQLRLLLAVQRGCLVGLHRYQSAAQDT